MAIEILNGENMNGDRNPEWIETECRDCNHRHFREKDCGYFYTFEPNKQCLCKQWITKDNLKFLEKEYGKTITI